MKKICLWLTVLVICVSVVTVFSLSGCKGTVPAAEEAVEEETEAVEEETEAVEEEAGEEVSFTVAAFEGGFGGEWIEKAISVFEEKHPNVTVEFMFDPKMHEKLQPMFVAGNPPDVCAPGLFFDLWGAILEGQLKPLEGYLDGDAIDKEAKWIETFEDGTFASATSDGHIWYLPLFSSSNSWWYNKTVWDEYGWTPPETWDEADGLFKEMRDNGVEPIANQGVYPLYIRYLYLPVFIARLAGPEKFEACWNLEADSWTDPEVVEAVAFLKQLADDYFQEGHIGMNHTQSQAEVMVGNAGLIACGDWFPKEEEEVWPEGNEIRAMDYPPFEDSPYPQKVHVKDHDSALMWVIPSEGKNEELAVEFLKILYSEDIQQFIVENTGGKTVYKGASEWLPDNKFGQAVKSSWERYGSADYTVPQRETIDMWYPTVASAIDDNILKMLSGEASPEETCASIQSACDEYRGDPDAFIHDFSLGLE